MHLPRVAALTLAALLLVGCTVSLRTAAAAVDACDLGLGGGTLVASAQSGLALGSGTGRVTEVMWPFGYTARRGTSGIELIGQKGEVLAREGDFVQVGGGMSNDGVFQVCDGSVQVVIKPV
jgi:hypothetical protein